jgi:D-glycero-alpha-D-manno-heptose-7-phosphate kinase
MHKALLRRDWDEVGRLLRQEWKLRRSNAAGITTPLIDKLIALAGKQGGMGAKVCGAGGGGCVVFLVDPDAKVRVAQAIGENGAQVLPLRVATEGVRVEVQ